MTASDHPPQVHVGDLVGDAVQAGHRQQQRDHQHQQDDERDEAAPQAPAGILVVTPARGAFEDDGSLGIIPESTKLVGALRHGSTIQAVTRVEVPGHEIVGLRADNPGPFTLIGHEHLDRRLRSGAGWSIPDPICSRPCGGRDRRG